MAEFEGQAGAQDQIVVSRDDLIDAIIAELEDYFSCPRVSGISLARHEAEGIAGGILLKLKGRDYEAGNRHQP